MNGFCPSFVTVEGAKLKKPSGAIFDPAALAACVDALVQPTPRLGQAPYDILVTGVGGTGVVTVGALISMAAHLEGKSASVLDFMGFAQKGGAVLSFVRFAMSPDLLNQVRIDTQQADVLLACDMVVGASADALQTVRRGRTRVVVNTHAIPNASFVQNPDANLHVDALLEKMRAASGSEHLAACDAQALATRFLGDTMGANILMLGYAWQLGLIPVSLAALMRAIELNNVAVPMNRVAFSIGRLAAVDTDALEALLHVPAAASDALEMDLEAVLADRSSRLLAYGGARGAAYVARYRALVEAAKQAEIRVSGADGPLTAAVAQTFYRLLAVKDEYEVARLYTNGAFRTAVEKQFEGEAGRDFRIKFHMAPPGLARGKNGQQPRKMTFGPWLWPALSVLARGRFLRGTMFDVFGRSAERKMEHALPADYATTMTRLLTRLNAENLTAAVELAGLHTRIRGYGHVKLANLVAIKHREQTLCKQLGIEVATSAAVAAALAEAIPMGRSLKGIPVVTAR